MGSQRTPIGALRERIRIQRRETSDDGMGGQASEGGWITAKETWASVLPLGASNEQLMAAKLSGMQMYQIVTRFTDQITVTSQIVWRGQVLQVHAVTDENSKKRHLAILAGVVK